MITLTDWKTHAPVMLDSKEIGAIKVVKSTSFSLVKKQRGDDERNAVLPVPIYTHSAIFIISDSGIYDHRIDVCETPEEISELIMAPLLEAGEKIRI